MSSVAVCCCADIGHRRLSLQWRERPPLGRVQELARQRRYGALSSACAEVGVSHLLIAHHLQDQWETALHRFTRASGILGLTAMAPSVLLSSSSLPPLHLCRPLLSIPQCRLLSTCHRFHFHHPIEDPSNSNPAFERIRVRHALRAMQHVEEGRVILAGLDEVQRVVKEVGEDVQGSVRRVLERWVRVERPLCVGVIQREVWLREGEELMVAVLSRLLSIVRGGGHRPLHPPLVDLVRRIRRGHLHPLLCAGCVLRPLPREGEKKSPRTLLVTRANTAEEVLVEGGGRVEWDQRFALHLTPPQGWWAGQWQWLVRALRPATDLLGSFKLEEKGRRRATLHHNLPVLVKRRRGTADGRRKVEEELICIPHLPELPRTQSPNRWEGWLVRVEQLQSEAPSWD